MDRLSRRPHGDPFQAQPGRELDTYRKGAALGVAGFEAALKIIRPGVTEYQIAAEIEYAARQEARGSTAP